MAALNERERTSSERKREGREEAGSTDKASPPPSRARPLWHSLNGHYVLRNGTTEGGAEDGACAALL